MHTQTPITSPFTQTDLDALQTDPAAHWVQDVDLGRVVWANSAAHQLLGAQTSHDLYSRDVSPLLPATKIRIENYRVRAVRGEKIDTLWTTFLHGNEPMPLLASIYPYQLPDGRIALLFKARLIAEHTCAEALRMIEAARHSLNLFAMFSQEGVVLERNAAFVLALGDLALECGDQFERLFIDVTQAELARATTITTGRYSARALLNTSNGSSWYALHSSIVLDPVDGQRIIHFEAMDISEQVKAEQHALQSERLLQTMADELPTPVCFVNEGQQYKFANRAYGDWVAAEPSAIIGQTVQQVAGATAATLLNHYWSTLQTGQRVNYERISQNSRRGPRWTSVDLIPHRLHNTYDTAETSQAYGAFVFGYDIHDKKVAQANTQSLQERLIQIAESLPVSVVQFDRDYRIRFSNQRFCDLHQQRADTVVGRHLFEIVGHHVFEQSQVFINRALNGETVSWRAMTQLEPARWFDFTVAPLRVRHYSADGKMHEEIEGAVGIGLDVHDQVTAKNHLQQMQEQLGAHLEATPLAVVQFDAFRRITQWNSRAQAVFGWDRADVFGRTLDEVGLFDLEQAARFDQELRFLDVRAVDRFTFSSRNMRREGQTVFCEWYCSVVRDHKGRPVSYLALVQDISLRVNAEQHLQYLTNHDVLTGLSNRAQFNENVRAEVERARRTGQSLALALFDLDKFKYVNESLGQHIGDGVLKQCAQRLRQLNQAVAIARLSADEFALLLPFSGSSPNVPDVLSQLHTDLNKPYRIGEQEVFTTASCGVAIFPADAAEEALLIKSADWALYRAKDAGRASLKAYADVADADGMNRVSIENDLRIALERGEFELHYQPKMQLQTGRVHSAEALLRWRHPTRGLIPPDVFIPLAEENGLIENIGEWVIDQACWQMAQWKAQRMFAPQIAVNLSPIQFKREALADDILSALRRFEIDGRLLMVEVTESSVITDPIRAAQTLERLRQNGVQCAIDDFGKGFSSLSQLRRLPIDALKIDSSFVRDVVVDRDDAMIVQAIIGLASNLGLKVVAEGVETAEQLQFLKLHACDEAQGYLFSRALPAHEFAQQFLANSQRHTT